ncbi:PREDICTED: uncharacterized protein LOC108977588 [Bactrocera latifrons]|uniref:uncharacterized protein LOC108977588 n=1 Tax=Bactrocera latifrons TaxID=174628 RepID=UPI0008DDAFB0|nr:PREDICTED: uncharacterized protein LOC108977588 [Bactrocera latifrons]
MYAYTNTADNFAYSLPHMSHANAAVLAPPNSNVSAAAVFFASSIAYTNYNYNPTSAHHNMPSYMQPITPHLNVTLRCYMQFSGSPEEWRMFIVAFKETTNMFAYSNVENLLSLQKALKGDARSKVESLLIHPSSVNAVISSLQFHYRRPELLIRSQLTKVRSFPSITSGKIHEIANYSSMVTNLVAFLENARAAPHLSKPTLLDELVSKLPIYKREEWARHTFAINKPYRTICEFSSWLQQMSTYVVMATELNTPHVSSEQPSRKCNRSPKTVLTISEEKFKCIFCKDNHRLYQCMKFNKVNNDKRWEISTADIRAEEILRSTTKFVGLLWKNDNISLPVSYNAALKPLQIVERKMASDINYKKWYIEKVNDYVDKGYAKKLTSDEVDIQSE